MPRHTGLISSISSQNYDFSRNPQNYFYPVYVLSIFYGYFSLNLVRSIFILFLYLFAVGSLLQSSFHLLFSHQQLCLRFGTKEKI